MSTRPSGLEVLGEALACVWLVCGLTGAVTIVRAAARRRRARREVVA